MIAAFSVVWCVHSEKVIITKQGFGDIMESVEKECGALGGLFQAIVNDMKVPALFNWYKVSNMLQRDAFVLLPLFSLGVQLAAPLMLWLMICASQHGGFVVKWKLNHFVDVRTNKMLNYYYYILRKKYVKIDSIFFLKYGPSWVLKTLFIYLSELF